MCLPGVLGLSYYTGPIQISALDFTVEALSPSIASVLARYTFNNTANTPITVEVLFPDFPASTGYQELSSKGAQLSLTLSPGEYVLNAYFNASFDSLTSFTLSPAYQLDQKVPVAKVGRLDYTFDFRKAPLVLVESTPRLEMLSESFAYVRLIAQYPTSLQLTLQQTALQARVTRTISSYSNIGDEIEIVSTITNRGSSSISGLTLQDSLFTAYFAPLGTGYSQQTTQEIGEALALYTSDPFTLNQGETKTIAYRARVVQLGAPPFPGARLFSNNQYISSSDETSPRYIAPHITDPVQTLPSGQTTLGDIPGVTTPPLSEENATRKQDNNDEQPPIFDEGEIKHFKENPPASLDAPLSARWLLIGSIGLIALCILGGLYLWYKKRQVQTREVPS
jgi:hypothetical protein